MHADNGIASRSFQGTTGGAEHFISVEAPANLSLVEQIDHVEKRYAEARQALSLAPETAIFRRVFLSDAMNQASLIRNSQLFDEPSDGPVAVSLVQQPPLRDHLVSFEL